MGIFGGLQSNGNDDDGKNKAFVRRLQNEFQMMETDFKKLKQERDLALRLKAELAKELSLLTTHIRENEKIVGVKDRAYALLEAELKRKKKEVQNQPH